MSEDLIQVRFTCNGREDKGKYMDVYKVLFSRCLFVKVWERADILVFSPWLRCGNGVFWLLLHSCVACEVVGNKGLCQLEA